MPDYIAPQIDDSADDPTSIAEDMREVLSTRVTGWEVWPASPTNLLIEAVALEHAETRRAATGAGQTFDRIARALGESVFGVAALDSAPASGSSTWTSIDADGPYTIPAGTQLTLRADDGSRVGFEVTADFTIANGQTEISGIQLLAVENGDIGNGLTQDPRLEDEWDFVDTITMDGPTLGGNDGETDPEYLDRFARTQRRQANSLITSEDFSDFAVDFFADGGRALTIPLYNAQTGAANQPGHFTVVPITEAGTARSTQEMEDLKTAISSLLLVGIVGHVIAPTYTNVTVSFTATSYPPYDPASVQAVAVAAVENFLDPANWGRVPYGVEESWLDEPVVRTNDLIAVLEGVDGLRHVLSITVNGSPNGNVFLNGPARLPQAGDVTGLVTAE